MAKDREDEPREPPVDPARWEAIQRFLDGLSPLPERIQVEEWIAHDLALQRYVKAHRKVWSMIARRMGPREVDPEGAWESVQDRIAEHDRAERSRLPGRGIGHLRVIDGGLLSNRRRVMWVARAVVAAAAIVVVCVATLAVILRRTGGVGLAARRVRSGPQVAFVVRRGEHPVSRQLPDGTEIVLAPDSHLEYFVDREGAHVANLIGEASFSVQHQTSRSFIVRAEGIETRDLGTEFDVRAYPGTSPRVAVRTGRVSLATLRGTTVLEAGLLGSVDLTTGVTNVSMTTADYFDWTSGRHVFTKASWADVAAELGRAYDLDIQLADTSLAARSVTITVPTVTREEAIALVAKVADLQYDWHGRTVRLFRR